MKGWRGPVAACTLLAMGVSPMESWIVRSRRRRGARGLALLTVLWALSILSLVAAAVLDRSSGDVRFARHLEGRAQAALAADAAIRVEVARLLADGGAAWPPDGAWRLIRLGAAAARARSIDESGLVDVNVAPPALLAALAAAAGARPADADAFAAMVAGLRRSGEGDLAMPDEISRVNGADPVLLRRLAPFLTTWSGMRTPNTLTAPPEVVAALAEVSAGVDAAPVEARDPAALAVQRIRRATARGRLGDRFVRIEAEAETAGGTRFARAAIVALELGPPPRWRALHWDRRPE